jgi:hypothetical protein
MINEVETELINFYTVLFENVKNVLQIRENSIFITLIGASQNKVLKLLSDSALPSESIQENNLQELLNLHLIKKDEFSEKYLMTAQGIWLIEKNKDIISESLLIEYFQQTQFQRKKGYQIELKYREKVVVLSMIAARSFSKDCCVNLAPKNKLHDSWKEIFDLSNNMLYDLGVINKVERDSLYMRAAHDPPVLTICRRLTDLTKRTNFIWQQNKNLNYWLEMPESEKEFKEIIASLLTLIFREKLTFQNIDIITEFCDRIAQNKSVYVYMDISNHKYFESKYDRWLKEALLMGIKGIP